MTSTTQVRIPPEVPRWHLHRRLYDWMLSWADTRYGLPALLGFAFLESSVFPIPPDILLIPLVLGSTGRWWKIALYTTIASVLGGILGYGIGMFAWDSMGAWIVEHIAHVKFTMIDGRADIALPAYLVNNFEASLGGKYLFQVYDNWNAWIVYLFGLTPLPYKLVTITAGVAHINFGVFVLASILSRGTRFFAVAFILRLFGERARVMIEKRFNLFCLIFTILLFAGVGLVKLVL